MANEKALQAYKLYKSGERLVDIAAALGVPDGTVRRWKSTQQWDKKAPSAKTKVNAKNERARANARTVRKMQAMAEANTQLNEQQKRFCLLYAQRPNATRAYRLAYEGCAYNTARTEGSRLLTNPAIQAEVRRQKQVLMEGLMGDPTDVFRMYWDIAFSDMGDYVQWGRAKVPVMAMYGPVMQENPEDPDGDKVPLTKEINEVRFRESEEVDSTLVAEVKQGRDGASVKLASKEKALQWLSDYFEMNPADQKRGEFNERRLAIEEAKAGALQQDAGDILFQIVAPRGLPEQDDENE
ncbi:terminase small subunit [Ruminococcaceae bacterium OttesenSCG-928-I18]|nr:terminase small subunit [Ruminococcaceae bacterium OttesenSCG-928-I18]